MNPREAAEQLVRTLNNHQVILDYSLKSLQQHVDMLMTTPGLFDDTEASWATECALEAYVGETLVRLFDGVWCGEFCSDNSGPNFYLSYVAFGDYRYFPSHFLGYRLSNGADAEGTFAQHLEQVLPMIRARVQSQ